MPRFFSLALALAFGLACSAACGATATVAPAEHFEHVQALRTEARQALQADSGPAGREQAAARLEAALTYLARPDVAAQGQGNSTLYFRGFDVRRDLAEQYAALGRREDALRTLERTREFVQLPLVAEYLRTQPEYAPLRAEPRFQALVAANALPGKILSTDALAVPYKDALTIEERVAGLSLFWAEVRDHFAFFDNVPELDWNRVYMEYLPRVIAARTTREYYDVLRTLAPRLKDGHTWIMPPGELADDVYATLPLAAALVEDSVLVRRVDDAALRGRIAVGDEITAIDGIPVRRYAEQHVLPLVSASTPHSQALYGYSDRLFDGAVGTTVRLVLRKADGRSYDIAIPRVQWTPAGKPPSFELRMLAGDIAYVAINQFETAEALDRFKAAFPTLRRARAIVLDLRNNGGGNGAFGVEILRHLTDKPFHGAVSYERGGEAAMRAQGMPAFRWLPMGAGPAEFQGAETDAYTGPVALLTGPRTFSAGEDFALAFDIMRRGPIIGTVTGGSTGQSLFFTLPGGGTARVCVKRDVYPDGRAFVGAGIAPTIEVPVTVADVRAGRDRQLERALAELARSIKAMK